MKTSTEMVKKPWGWEEILTNTPYYCAKYIFILPRYQTSVHYHIEKDETLFVRSNAPMTLELYSEHPPHALAQQILVCNNEGYRVLPGVVHRLVNKDETKTLVLLEVSTHHDDRDTMRPFGFGGPIV